MLHKRLKNSGTSIRNRIAITVLATVLLVSMLGTAISGRNHAERLTKALKSESQVLTSVFGDTLADPLWDYDYGMVQQRLERFAATGAMIGAQVLDDNGQVLAQVLVKGFDPKVPGDHLAFYHGIWAESGESVGTLYLWVSTAGVSEEVWSLVRDDALTATILAVITAVTVFVGINLISGPLSRVTGAMIRIGEGAFDTPVPERGRDDEVSRMAEALEELRLKGLRVEQVEQELRRANASLEQRVSQRTAQLEKAREQAVEANRAKTEFLANMSHDLRTPLNAILGFSELMRAGAFGPLGDPRYEEYVEDIHHSGSLLISLINDLLDISKVEAGKYELAEETVDLCALVHSCIKQVTTAEEAEGKSLDAVVPEDLPALRGDERVVTQVLNNLLSNAVKFTPHGGSITVNAWCDGTGQISLSVADNGIGMTADGVQKALRPFEQAHNPRAREHKGTGLGLHLCDNFMKLFGGSLEIESQAGEGTTVTVVFPAKRALSQRQSA